MSHVNKVKLNAKKIIFSAIILAMVGIFVILKPLLVLAAGSGLTIGPSAGTGVVIDVSGGQIGGLNSTPILTDQAVPLGYLEANYSPIGSGIGSAFVQGGNSFGAAGNLGTNDNNLLNIETNNAVRMTIAANGNVGIGTTAPGEKLEIAGNIKLPANNYIAALGSPTSGNGGYFQGTAEAGSNAGYGAWMNYNAYWNGTNWIQPRGTLSTSMYSTNYHLGWTWRTAGASGTNGSIITPAEIAKLSTSGSLTLSGVLQASGTGSSYLMGNVGVGTTAPNQKLDIVGTAFVRGNGTIYNNANAADLQVGYGIAAAGTVGSVARLALQPYGHTGGPWLFTTRDAAGTANLDISYGAAGSGISLQNNGSIGIGTTIPVSRLNISEATGTVHGAAQGSVVIDHENSGGASSIVFRSRVNRGSDYGFIQYQDTATVGGAGETAKFIIGTSNDTNDDIALMPTGNVGVGILIPTNKLHVSNGTIQVASVAGGHIGGLNSTPINADHAVPLGYLQGNYAPIGTGAGSAFVQGGNSYGAAATLGTNDNNLLNIETNNAVRMTVATNGSVGIGTTNPGIMFQVRSDGLGTWGGRMGLANATADKEVFFGTYGSNAGVFAHNNALSAWAPLYVNTVSGSTDGGNVIIAGSASVGIGTSAPGAKLDVAGGINLTDRQYTLLGNVRTFENVAQYHPGSTPTTGTVVVTIANTPNVMLDAEIVIQGYSGLTKCHVRGYTYTSTSGWHLPAATCLGSGSTGSYVVRFGKRISDSARVIMIGTTSTNWGNYPHVAVTRVSYGYPGTGSSPGDWSIGIVTDEAAYDSIVSVAENSGFNANNSTLDGNTYFPGSGIWNSSGNVGIGITAPTNKLHVSSGTGQVVSVAGGHIGGLNSTPVNADQAVPLGYLESNYAPIGTGAGSAFVQGGNSYGTTATLGTNDNNLLNIETNNAVRMTVATNGSVGIGTTNPGVKLDVLGDVRASAGVYAAGASGFYSSTYVAAARNPVWRFGNADGYGVSYFQGTAGIGNLDTMGFHFGTATAAASLLQINQNGTITTSGNVGIGTTNPTYTLDVTGNIRATGDFVANGNYGLGLVGLYSATRYQNVFAMGAAYRLTADGLGAGNLYGIAWTHTNIGGQSKSPLSHQALFMTNGVTQTAIGTGIWTLGGYTQTGATANTFTGVVNINAGTAQVLNVTGGHISGLNSTPVNADQAVPLGYLQANYSPSSGSLWNGTLNGNIYNGTTGAGNVGIGTTAPGAKLDIDGNIIQSVTHGTYLGLSLSAARNGGGTGQVGLYSWISEPGATWTGGGIARNMRNSASTFPRVTAGLSGQMMRFTESGSIEFTVENTSSVRYTPLTVSLGGNVGINKTAPTLALDVVGSINATGVINATSLGIAGVYQTSWADFLFKTGAATVTVDHPFNLPGLFMGNMVFSAATSSISGITKLTVGTIDPLYSINGTNYSTFATSMVGGVKEEYVGKTQIITKNKINDEYETVIDFTNQEKGSDLWVWRKVIEFNKDSVEVQITPYGKLAQVYYLINGNKLIFRSDKPVEISYRLVAKRFDWTSWPTLATDQSEKASFTIND